MRIHRRTAIWICFAVVLASLSGAVWWVTRPSYLASWGTRQVQSMLPEGWAFDLKSVDYDLWKGMLRLDGLTLRAGPGKEVVARIGKAEMRTRLNELLAHRRYLTDVRLEDVEIVAELTAGGDLLPWSGLFPPGGQGGGSRPRIRVKGGLLRVRAPALLAAGEEVRLDVETLDWEESRSGDPSTFRAILKDRGSASPAGAGALGPVTVEGELPLSPRGLALRIEKFQVDEFLRQRLSPSVREQIALVAIDGTFGEGSAAPGLEVVASQEAGAAAPGFRIRTRLRGVNVIAPAFPLLFTDVRGDLSMDLRDGTVRIDHVALKYDGATIGIHGTWGGLRADAKCDLRFWARDFYLSRGLRGALPPAVTRVWDAYDFGGKVDLADAPPPAPGSNVPESYDSWIRRGADGGPLELHIDVRLVEGELSYRGYPGDDGVRRGFDYPVTGITGRVSLRYPLDGGAYEIELRDVRGRHGDAEITACGSVKDWPGGPCKVDIAVEAPQGMDLDEDVRTSSPSFVSLFRTWSPRGHASRLKVQVDQDPAADASASESVTIEMDGKGGFTYEKLPIPLDGVSGTVFYSHPLIDGRRTTVYSIRGVRGTTSEGATFAADGTLEGDEDPRLNIRVHSETLLLDGELESALRSAAAGVNPGLRNAVGIWDRLKPSGPVDIDVAVAGTAKDERDTYHLTLRGAFAKGWDDVQFPVGDLTGIVDISPEEVRLRRVRGLHEGREAVFDGSIADPGGKATLDLSLTTTQVPLDESARGVLGHVAENLKGYFTTVEPKPGLTGDAWIRLRGPTDALDATVRIENLRGGLAPLDLRDFEVRGGSALYEGGKATLTGLEGFMGDREFTVRRADLDLDRGFGTMHLEVRRLRFPRDLVGILPEETAAAIEKVVPDRFIHMDGLDVILSDGWRRTELRGTVSLSPQKETTTGGIGLKGTFLLKDGLVFQRGPGPGDPTAVSGGFDLTAGAFEAGVKVEGLEGHFDVGGSFGPGGVDVTATMKDATGRVEGRELKEGGGPLGLKDGTFFARVSGNLARGQLGATVEVRGEGKGYGVKVSLANAGAAALFAPADPKSELRGNVTADLRIGTDTGRIENLGGKGSVEITDAKLFKVPVFDGIYSLLGMKAPLFTSGKMEFKVDGDKLVFDTLDLESEPLGLHKAVGQSSARVDGSLSIKLRPEIKTGIWLPFYVVGTLLRPFLERLYTISVGGTIQKPDVSFGVFPGLFSVDDKGAPHPDLPPPPLSIERRPPRDF